MAAEAIAGCIPGATLAVIEGVGHNGPVEAKDAFVKLTLDFVDAHDGDYRRMLPQRS